MLLVEQIQAFEDKLIKCMSNGANKLSIILNGRYFLYHSKMVYVKLQKDQETNKDRLFCFTKRVEKPKEVEVPEAINLLVEELISSELYNLPLSRRFTLEDFTITIDQDLSLLILESGIYNAIREFASDKDFKSKSFKNQEQIHNLVRAFKEKAYRNFSSVILSRTSTKFIMRFYNSFKFYKTMYSFIPVFIYYPNLYNPFFDNPDNNIEVFKIYKTAVEKGRIVSFDNGLKAYMLTHEEICRAFAMKHFVRFTPTLFYELFVGLLNPTLDTFPSISNKVFVKPDNLDVTTKLPQCYSKLHFIYELQKCNSANDKASETKLEILQQYVEKDSLYYCCEKNLQNLFNYGPSVIDPPRITADMLYSYLQEMTLVVD